MSVFGEEVGGFTDGACEIDGFASGQVEVGGGPSDFEAAGDGDRPDEMEGVIKCGSQKIVHGGVDDDDFFIAGGLGIEDFGDEDGGVGGDASAGFEDDLEIFVFKERQDGLGEFFEGDGQGGVVIESEATADVEGFDLCAMGFELIDEV